MLLCIRVCLCVLFVFDQLSVEIFDEKIHYQKDSQSQAPLPQQHDPGGGKIRFLRQRAGTVRPTLAGHQRYGFKSQPEQVCLRHPHACVFSLEIFFHFGKIWPDWGQMEFSKMVFHALLGIITAFCSLSLCLGHNLGWTWLILGIFPLMSGIFGMVYLLACCWPTQFVNRGCHFLKGIWKELGRYMGQGEFLSIKFLRILGNFWGNSLPIKFYVQNPQPAEQVPLSSPPLDPDQPSQPSNQPSEQPTDQQTDQATDQGDVQPAEGGGESSQHPLERQPFLEPSPILGVDPSPVGDREFSGIFGVEGTPPPNSSDQATSTQTFVEPLGLLEQFKDASNPPVPQNPLESLKARVRQLQILVGPDNWTPHPPFLTTDPLPNVGGDSGLILGLSLKMPLCYFGRDFG